MTKRAAVVVGVGAIAGLGTAVARRFVREGLHTYIAGRTLQRLDAVAANIASLSGLALPVVIDATEEGDVQQLFDLVASHGASLEVVVFNVGNNLMVPLLETSPEAFTSLWRQNAMAGFLVGREAVRTMLPQARGTIIITGATASLRARPPFTAFASAKAALRAVAQGLAREFGPHGIHVVHAVIDGVIAGDYARTRFPEFVAAKGDGGLIEPDAIADTYWALHQQPQSAWTHELDLRPYKEPF
jgi:NAD(P)-dependent dehydrogenase (short-subunit alcohol dehydrogenase family)